MDFQVKQIFVYLCNHIPAFLPFIWTHNSEVHFLGYPQARLDRGLREVSLDGSGLILKYVFDLEILKGLQSFKLHTKNCLIKIILRGRLENAQAAVLLH